MRAGSACCHVWWHGVQCARVCVCVCQCVAGNSGGAVGARRQRQRGCLGPLSAEQLATRPPCPPRLSCPLFSCSPPAPRLLLPSRPPAEVLGSILGALKSIVAVIGMTRMTPPIKDLLPRLTPILKNR